MKYAYFLVGIIIIGIATYLRYVIIRKVSMIF